MEDNEDDLGMNIQLSDVHDDTDVSDVRRSQVERSVEKPDMACQKKERGCHSGQLNACKPY